MMKTFTRQGQEMVVTVEENENCVIKIATIEWAVAWQLTIIKGGEYQTPEDVMPKVVEQLKNEGWNVN